MAILREKGISEEIVKMFGLLRNDVFAQEQQIEQSNVIYALKTLAVSPDEVQDWRQTYAKLLKIIGKVNLHYNFMDDFMDKPRDTNRLILEDYARSIIQPGSTQSTAMLSALEQLNNMAIPTHDGGGQLLHGTQRGDIMYKLYMLLVKNRENICNLQQSPHQLILNLYNLIALSEIKGYMMVQFSYVMFKVYGRDSLSMESDLAKRKYNTNTAYKISFAKEILQKVSSDFWLCDAKRPLEGQTYIRMTQLLQVRPTILNYQ